MYFIVECLKDDSYVLINSSDAIYDEDTIKKKDNLNFMFNGKEYDGKLLSMSDDYDELSVELKKLNSTRKRKNESFHEDRPRKAALAQRKKIMDAFPKKNCPKSSLMSKRLQEGTAAAGSIGSDEEPQAKKLCKTSAHPRQSPVVQQELMGESSDVNANEQRGSSSASSDSDADLSPAEKALLMKLREKAKLKDLKHLKILGDLKHSKRSVALPKSSSASCASRKEKQVCAASKELQRSVSSTSVQSLVRSQSPTPSGDSVSLCSTEPVTSNEDSTEPVTSNEDSCETPVRGTTKSKNLRRGSQRSGAADALKPLPKFDGQMFLYTEDDDNDIKWNPLNVEYTISMVSRKMKWELLVEGPFKRKLLVIRLNTGDQHRTFNYTIAPGAGMSLQEVQIER